MVTAHVTNFRLQQGVSLCSTQILRDLAWIAAYTRRIRDILYISEGNMPGFSITIDPHCHCRVKDMRPLISPFKPIKKSAQVGLNLLSRMSKESKRECNQLVPLNDCFRDHMGRSGLTGVSFRLRMEVWELLTLFAWLKRNGSVR